MDIQPTVLDDSVVDDEIWIGPINPEYTKRLFQHSYVQPGDRRRTFNGFEDTSNRQDLADTTGSYSKHAYHTPDVTMSQDMNFIDKVSEILNPEGSQNTSYVTAADSTRMLDLLDSYPSAPFPDAPLATLPTLVDNMNSMQLDRLISISDSEDDHDHMRYQGTQVKYEDITHEEIKDEDLSTKEEQESQTFNDTLDDMEEFLRSEASFHNAVTPRVNITEYITERRDQMTPRRVNIASVPSIQVTEPQDQMFKLPEAPPKKKPASASKNKPTKGMYENVISPVSNYIHGSALPRRSPGMSPHPPTRTGIPRPLFPTSAVKSPNERYKNIASPVGAYIKYSATSRINRSVTTRALPAKLPEELFADEDEENRPNVERLVLPAVIYKPAQKKEVIKTTRVIKLPANIVPLMTNVAEVFVAKHEGRIYRNAQDPDTIARRLNEEPDLTLTGWNASGLPDVSYIQINKPL